MLSDETGVGVGVGIGVGIGVEVGVGDGVGAGVGVGVAVGSGVGFGEGVSVGVGVSIGAGVSVGEGVEVATEAGDGEGVGESEAMGSIVGDKVGDKAIDEVEAGPFDDLGVLIVGIGVAIIVAGTFPMGSEVKVGCNTGVLVKVALIVKGLIAGANVGEGAEPELSIGVRGSGVIDILAAKACAVTPEKMTTMRNDIMSSSLCRIRHQFNLISTKGNIN